MLAKLCKNEQYQCKITFTSQVKVSFTVEEFQPLYITTLYQNETVQLLEGIIPNITKKDARNVAKIVDNMPLAAKVIAAVIRFNKLTPSEVVSQFKEQKRNIIEKLSPPEFPIEERVTTCLTIAYQNLNEDARRCARLLAKFPGSFSQTAAEFIVNFPYNLLRKYFNVYTQIPCMDELLRKSFMEQVFINYELESRYNFHQLIRTFLHNVETNRKLIAEENYSFRRAFMIYYTKVLDLFDLLLFNALYAIEEEVTTAVQLGDSHPNENSVENLVFRFMEADGHNIELYFNYIREYKLVYQMYENSVSLMPYFIKLTLFRAAYLKKAFDEITVFNKSVIFDTDNKTIITNECLEVSNRLQSLLSRMELYESILTDQIMSAREYFKLYLYVLLYNTVVASNWNAAIDISDKRIEKLIQISSSFDDDHMLLSRYLHHNAILSLNGHVVDRFIKYYSFAATLKIKTNDYSDNGSIIPLYIFALFAYGEENYQQSIKFFNKVIDNTDEVLVISYIKVILYYVHQHIGEFENAEEMKEFVLSDDTEIQLVTEIEDCDLDIFLHEYILIKLVQVFYCDQKSESRHYCDLVDDMIMIYWKEIFSFENFDYERIYPLEN